MYVDDHILVKLYFIMTLGNGRGVTRCFKVSDSSILVILANGCDLLENFLCFFTPVEVERAHLELTTDLLHKIRYLSLLYKLK